MGQLLGSLPWEWLVAALHLILALMATVHALLYKRDPRAALGWVSMCLFFPLAGSLLYYTFGINRVQTQAHRLSGGRRFRFRVGYERGSLVHRPTPSLQLDDDDRQLFVAVADHVSTFPLCEGNRITMLRNGEQAYPAMLAAIAGAEHYVLLITYLFQWDAVGRQFVAALKQAQARGVKVYVLLDGVGEWYSWPGVVVRHLRRAGVAVERFLPPRLLPPSFSINLRNHRKILVVDGEQAFTGGMNIGVRHLLESESAHRTSDLHFAMRGSVVQQLQQVFRSDWQFASGRPLDLLLPPQVPQQVSLQETVQEAWHAGTSDESVCCRCISDGPGEDLDRIALVLMGTISAAREQLTLITPYFLPSRELIGSLQAAALRGVAVTVILPEKSNLRMVDWASRNLLWELLQYGVRVRYQPPPFAHTKLLLIDGHYAQVGSANIDARSLRLNFELNVEIHGASAVAPLQAYGDEILHASRQVTLREIVSRPLPARIRDAACWLFLPYL
ncbi:cardiolipin synthase [Pseudomaricurvus sp. HS19]|nr:cardiolipin synthase [Pseudomaricurvus sp. HS19]